MRKNFKYYVFCWFILVLLFHIIVLLIPNEVVRMNKFNGTFWVSYGGILLAFIGQLLCAYFTFKEENKQKIFYNLPLITISYFATLISVVLGAIFMVIPSLPNYLGAIACVLVLGLNTISVIKAKAAADMVGFIENKVQNNTHFIKSLTVDMENLKEQAMTDPIKAEVKKIYEAVRYSDPISNDALADLESQIVEKYDALTQAVAQGNLGMVQAVAGEMIILINNRNKKCKLLK